MPIADVMNFMNSSAPPLISEQRNARDMGMAKGIAGISSVMADTDAKQYETGLKRKKQGILENFEGRTNSKQFYDKMMTVSPDTVAKMRKSAMDQLKGNAEVKNALLTKRANMARMAEDETAWKQMGFNVPFEMRGYIIAMGESQDTIQKYYSTNKQAETADKNRAEKVRTANLDRIAEASSGTEDEWMPKASDESLIWRVITSAYKGTYGPSGDFNFKNKSQNSEARAIADVAAKIFRRGQGKVSRLEAANMATEQVLGKGNSNKYTDVDEDNIKDPLGMR